MPAQLKLISTRLGITISLGEDEGKKVTKTVSISNIGAACTAETLDSMVNALGDLLKYPVASAKVYKTELLEGSEAA